MWAKTQEQELGPWVSLEAQARGYGLRLDPGNNDRIGGWTLVNEAMPSRLTERAVLSSHVVVGEGGGPRAPEAKPV